VSDGGVPVPDAGAERGAGAGVGRTDAAVLGRRSLSMKGRALVGLVIGLLGGASLLAGEARDKAARKDLKAFAGKWRAASVETGGKKAPDKELADVFVTHEGNKVTVRKGDKVIVQGTIELDPTKKPRTVDFTSAAGKDKGKVYLGIYEFKDDSYRLCLAGAGQKRPTAFSSKLGALLVYKRDKKKQ
jgi:uncharacterized protein (TIGR03067 family)